MNSYKALAVLFLVAWLGMNYAAYRLYERLEALDRELVTANTLIKFYEDLVQGCVASKP